MLAERPRPQDVVSRRLPKLVEVVDPEVILPHLPCISSARKETIRCEQKSNGKEIAVQALIQYLQGRDNWFMELCAALRHPAVGLSKIADILIADLEGFRDVNRRRHRRVNKHTPIRELTGGLQNAFKRLEHDTLENWQIFAEKVGYTVDEIHQFQRQKSPALALFQDWMTTDGATLGKLLKTLSGMQRDDILTHLEEQTSAGTYMRRHRARLISRGETSTVSRRQGYKGFTESAAVSADSGHPRRLSEGHQLSHNSKCINSSVLSRGRAGINKVNSAISTQAATKPHPPATGAQQQSAYRQERNMTLSKETRELATRAPESRNVTSVGSDGGMPKPYHAEDRFESQSEVGTSLLDEHLSSARYNTELTNPSSTEFDLDKISTHNPASHEPRTAEKNPSWPSQDVGVREIGKPSSDVEKTRQESEIGAPIVRQPCIDSAFFKDRRKFIDEVEQKFSDCTMKSFHSHHTRPPCTVKQDTGTSESSVGVQNNHLHSLDNVASSSFVDIRRGTSSVSVNVHTARDIHSPAAHLNKSPPTLEYTDLATTHEEKINTGVSNDKATVPKEAFYQQMLDSGAQGVKEFEPHPSQASLFFGSEASTVVPNMETSLTDQKALVSHQCTSFLNSSMASTEWCPKVATAAPNAKVNLAGRPCGISSQAYAAYVLEEPDKVMQKNASSSLSSTPNTKWNGVMDFEPSADPNNSHQTMRHSDHGMPEEKVESNDPGAHPRDCPDEGDASGSNTSYVNRMLTIGAASACVLAIKVLQHI